jgi:hypothetical protein
MVTLREAVETVQVDLRVMQKESHEGTSLTRPLDLLSRVVLSLPGGGNMPIILAKWACEAIVNCAHVAEDAENTDVAERLRGVVRTLSPVVAGLL